MGHFALGQPDEALSALDRAHKNRPDLVWGLTTLAVTYVELDRIEEARAVLAPIIKYRTKKGYGKVRGLNAYMFWHPFKDQEVEKKFANGLLEAGFPVKSGEYFKIYPENRLSGEKIKNLSFAHTVSGFGIYTGKQWRIKRARNGNSTYHSPKEGGGEASKVEELSDTGKSWIEGDRLCSKGDNLYGGYTDCLTIYSNPEGTLEGKDDYIGVSVYGFVPFSVVD